MKIESCKVNHLVNPVGFQMNRTVFSWKVTEAEGKMQRAARIVISENPDMTAPAADTGWKEDLDSLGTEVTALLKPRTRWYWQVIVRSDAGEEQSSDVQFFESGKMEESWTGKWISCDNSEKRHPVFEKEIKPAKKVAQARLYICGLGLYEAYFTEDSGEPVKIGDEYLTPGTNDYNRWVQVQTYDVSEQMKTGGKLSVLLGNGWYKARFGFSAVEDKGYYGNEWKLIGEVHLQYEDGSEDVIGTDDSWTVRRSDITFSNLYDGEHRDAGLPDLPLEKAVFTEAPKGRLSDRWSLPVTAHEVMKPQQLIHTPAGETVLDLGQNFAGIFTLHADVPAGTVVRIQTGETLIDGCFSNANLRTAKSEYIYRSCGKPETIRPHFTYYGFRYVKIEGIPDLRMEDFTGYALYSDIEMKGDVVTDHPLVNQLISNIRWGLKSNFVDTATDCPQRDERMGWTADTQVFSPTACYLADSYAFYAKFLHDVWEEQQENGGRVPDVVPSAGVDSVSSVWGDAATIIPWNVYRFYGDSSILREQYESMKAWVEYIRKTDGETHHWREVFHYGDWLALDHPSGSPDEVKGATDDGFIADVYYAQSIDILAKSAEILGKETDAAFYRELAEAQLDYIRKEYYSQSGRCCIPTQTAYLLTLKYGLSCDPERIRRELLRQFDYSQGKLKTGFVGTPILCNVLSDQGYSDLAYRIVLNEEYPGWLREVKLGATTVWERWNSLDEEGHFTSLDMNSLNHYAEGSILEWIFSNAAGIRPAAPGFRKALIAPQVSGEPAFLKCTYDSAAGKYEVSWQVNEDRRIAIDVTVPFGCSAGIRLPHAPSVVVCNGFPLTQPGVLYAGNYTFSYQMTGAFHHYSIDTQIRELLKIDGITDRIPALKPIEAATEMFKSYTVREFAGQMTKAFLPGQLEEADEELRKL